LQNGHLVDEGTFVDLQQRSKVFNELWKHQQQDQQDEQPSVQLSTGSSI
jgi:hypothetical protein